MTRLFDILLSDLRASKRNVNRLMGAGILFVLLSHFYVVEPYFQYKAQERKAQETLKTAEGMLDVLLDQFNRIKSVSDRARTAFSDVQREIADYPDHLRNTLPEIENAVSSDASPPFMQQAAPLRRVGRFQMPSRIETFEEGVRWYIESWFGNLLDELEREIVSPIVELKIEAKESTAPELEKMAVSAIVRLRSYLDSINPEFWRNYEGGKQPVALELQRVVEESIGPLQGEVNKMMLATMDEMKKQEKKAIEIKEELALLKKETEELGSRLESLESPLGRLPLDLRDLIVLFPLLIAAMTVMLAASARKSRTLYKALHREFTENNEKPDPVVFKYFADCWHLAPYSNIFQPILIAAWAAFCTVIFGRASVLIIKEIELFTGLGGEVESFKYMVFIGGYIFGCVAIAGALWFLYGALRGTPQDRFAQDLGSEA